jgi:hypothetical protein
MGMTVSVRSSFHPLDMLEPFQSEFCPHRRKILSYIDRLIYPQGDSRWSGIWIHWWSCEKGWDIPELQWITICVVIKVGIFKMLANIHRLQLVITGDEHREHWTRKQLYSNKMNGLKLPLKIYNIYNRRGRENALTFSRSSCAAYQLMKSPWGIEGQDYWGKETGNNNLKPIHSGPVTSGGLWGKKSEEIGKNRPHCPKHYPNLLSTPQNLCQKNDSNALIFYSIWPSVYSCNETRQIHDDDWINDVTGNFGR